jgi:hypothetical protein
VLTGSHHPPALWKTRNDYYSSSQPFKIIGQFRKINRIKSSCFILKHQIPNGQTAGITKISLIPTKKKLVSGPKTIYLYCASIPTGKNSGNEVTDNETTHEIDPVHPADLFTCNRCQRRRI